MLGRAFESIDRRRTGVEAPAIHRDLDDAFLDTEEAETLFLVASYSMVRRLLLRRVVTESGSGLEPTEGAGPVVAYYANSIRHHLEPEAIPGPEV